jgi:ammonia channel protein AmtB
MNFVEPETWSDAVYFGLGAVIGLVVGCAAAGLLEVKLATAVAIVGGVTIVGGLLGVLLREHLVEILIRWPPTR